MDKTVVLTGDRPTGALHLGHYVGSLKTRVQMQNTGKYDMYILIADIQALTDNAGNPQKIRENIIEVALDYLAVGLEPDKTKFVVQSHIPALYELPMYYSNLVTMARLERNPTIKSEIQLRNFARSIPVGFMTYPISQAADITAFNARYVPVGDDQLPMIEQTREIVSAFNRTYSCSVLTEPEAVLPDGKSSYRLVGTDGGSKMSKSLGNCIYLKDEPEDLKKKVMNMFTDPKHLRISDPGQVENNPVFIYLDTFCTDEHFSQFCNDYSCLDEMKEHYKRGGLGDIKVKKFLNNVLQTELEPIRNRRKEYEKDKGAVLEMLRKHTEYAAEYTGKTLEKVRSAIGINYFDDESFKKNFI